MSDEDVRREIATAVLAKLAGRDDKQCRRRSKVLEAIAYADELIYRLSEPKKERNNGKAETKDAGPGLAHAPVPQPDA